jgi:hypothetical protein
MKPSIFFFILVFFANYNVKSQDFTIFDHPLNARLSLCESIENYNFSDNFRFVKIGKNLYSLISNEEGKVILNKAITLMKDSMDTDSYLLNQISMSSKDYKINEENFKKLYDETEIIIDQFVANYGNPTKLVKNETFFFGEDNEFLGGSILAATWIDGKTKLQVLFSKDVDFRINLYAIRIFKFQDYLGNMKVPDDFEGF